MSVDLALKELVDLYAEWHDDPTMRIRLEKIIENYNMVIRLGDMGEVVTATYKVIRENVNETERYYDMNRKFVGYAPRFQNYEVEFVTKETELIAKALHQPLSAEIEHEGSKMELLDGYAVHLDQSLFGDGLTDGVIVFRQLRTGSGNDPFARTDKDDKC